jgi:hypothetical protein
MAAVLDALAPSVIKDMSEEELSMLLGVSVEIEKLEGKVENIKAYLADAERRRINEARVQRWVSKLKDALYEAADVLELCCLDAEEAAGRVWRRRRRVASGRCSSSCGTRASPTAWAAASRSLTRGSTTSRKR